MVAQPEGERVNGSVVGMPLLERVPLGERVNGWVVGIPVTERLIVVDFV
jgi:hypothetical protein